MLEAADRLKRVQRIGAANQYRRSNGKPRRRRSEGTGEACILLRAAGIREHLPGIDPELLKFWLIGASYADGIGRAWAAQKEFMRYGYNARSVNQYFEILDSLGLIRFIRKGERDKVTGRMLHNVYQFNPALVYVRKALREQAAALSPVPFESRFSNPILTSREQMNHNQVLRTKTTNQNNQPNRRTNTTNGIEDGESRFSPQPEKRESVNRREIDSSASNPAAKNSAKRATQPRSATAQSATPTPPHSPPAPPPGAVFAPPIGSPLYRRELLQPAAEKMAQKLNALTGNMSMHTARYLVTKYGAERCSTAVGVYTLQGVDTLKNPGGFIRSIIERGAVSVEDDQRGKYFDGDDSAVVNLW